MLNAVLADKINGFGSDYIFVEGSYGHTVIARREIARVLCEKVEEGRFSEQYTTEIGRMLLRDNAIEDFNLDERRKATRNTISECETASTEASDDRRHSRTTAARQVNTHKGSRASCR